MSTRTIVTLNGTWEFKETQEKKWAPAIVPGSVHTDLLANRVIEDPFYGSNELDLTWIEQSDFEYRRTFAVDKTLLNRKTIELIAEGLDTVATIFINGKKVADTENMFLEHRFNIKKYLHQGTNTINIHFANPMAYIQSRKGFTHFSQPNDPVGGASAIRKMQCSFGWDWGPRLPSCGIWRPIRIEGRDTIRISSVYTAQKHTPEKVRVSITPQTSRAIGSRQSWHTSLAIDGNVVAESNSLNLTIPNPRLWWPNNLGEQPLYDLTVELKENGSVIDSWQERIGLRTITLHRHKDQWGKSFQFMVNGVAVYAKGASWIPAHSFPSSVTAAMYNDLISSAVEANYNMLRVWGGGIYEHEAFYRLCDEKGIMVWQDFMFACSMYPHDERFHSSVVSEARQQVARLSNHACLALWCGNNELEEGWAIKNAAKPVRASYERIFYRTIPTIIKELAPQANYWPSSPHNPEGIDKGTWNEKAGDAHYWEVWHGRAPAETAQKRFFRFWSEFGMQAYPSKEVVDTFVSKEGQNIFSPDMDNHQKCPTGNGLIFNYISQRYRFPRDFASLLYLSQVNQAYCIAMMIEHQRACMPRTMGSLYWQINDCWPVASWSSIDFGGQWKGLHYAARRFFAPTLLTFRRIGEESVGRINRQVNTVSGIEILTVRDGREAVKGVLCWNVYDLTANRIVLSGSKKVTLEFNQSIMQKKLDLSKEILTYGKRNIVVHVYIAGQSEILAQNTVFLAAPKHIDLPKEKPVPLIKKTGEKQLRLTFRSKTFQHMTSFHFKGMKYRATDNFFDLFPSIPHSVTVDFEETVDIPVLQKKLQIMSVADSY